MYRPSDADPLHAAAAPGVSPSAADVPAEPSAPAATLDALAMGLVIARNLRLLVLLPLLAGAVAAGITYLIKPVFTARAVIMSPQQTQSASAMALQNLGALAGVAGAAAGIKSPADQYVGLMQSRTVEDRLIDQFELLKVYESELRFEARKRLKGNVQIQAGKKDGLISIEVDDEDPARAAAMANAYVTQLSRLTNELAVTEAQQRRKFFEEQLQQTTAAFAAARRALQATGINEGVIRAEPRSAAESYAKLRAEITAAEVRLQSASVSLAESAPEIRRLRTELDTLRAMAAKAEGVDRSAARGDYIDRYKEFKYQETLLDLFARQYELARVDESREGAIVQVVDAAQPPERKSRPRRAVIAVVTTLLAGVVCLLWLLAREYLAVASGDRSPDAARWRALRQALRPGREGA